MKTVEVQKTQKSQIYFKIILSTLGVFLILGISYFSFQEYQKREELKVQAEYYKLEKMIFKKRETFSQAKAEKMKVEENKAKDKKPNEMKFEIKTGDLEKDFGDSVAGLKSLAAKNINLRGSQMAALLLSNLYIEYKQFSEAKELIEKALLKSQQSLVQSLLLNQMGTIYANQKDCTKAISTWNQILDQKNYNYLHREILYRQAVCYESMNQLNEAERKYLEASQSVSKKDNSENSPFALNDSETLKEAEKALKALKIRKNFENFN